MADSKLETGDHVKITNVVVNHYKEETSLCTTNISSIKTVDPEPEKKVTTIIGYTSETDDITFTVDDHDEVLDLTIPKTAFKDRFNLSDDLDELDNFLKELCNQQLTFTVMGGAIQEMETDF
ncbi:uncharacterized protein [Argopecten irradians]|uniref:uncharacterized protein n=1 Tax=Argopecten irradians TaxID=31199 RepID=UPI003720044E